MAVASYLIGRRYYPVDYPIGRMAAYLSAAVIIYFASVGLEGWLQPTLPGTLALNTCLLGVYLAGVYLTDRKRIHRLLPFLDRLIPGGR